MPWHVCGTPRRSLALPLRDLRSSDALNWDFVGAPSATRMRDRVPKMLSAKRFERIFGYPLTVEGTLGH
jgi:hypothetical protein